jgi:hypothetical protein
LALRQQLAIPALAELHAWLLVSQRTAAAGSGKAKAIDHALKRWPALQRYASSGSLPIDNNPVENAARHGQEKLVACRIRMGRPPRRRHPEPLTMAKLNGIDPARWQASTLDRLPACPNRKIDSLLPFVNSTQH